MLSLPRPLPGENRKFPNPQYDIFPDAWHYRDSGSSTYGRGHAATSISLNLI